MKCRRCGKEANTLKATPVGGFIICSTCIEEVIEKQVERPILYFGRCYRDQFRLCSDECSHLELGPEVKRVGQEPRVEVGYCNAARALSSTVDQLSLVRSGSDPTQLRRRSSDEYLAALLLMTEGAKSVEEHPDPVQSPPTQEEEQPREDADEGPRKGAYREGDWE